LWYAAAVQRKGAAAMYDPFTDQPLQKLPIGIQAFETMRM
jgi:hypothetical protein